MYKKDCTVTHCNAVLHFHLLPPPAKPLKADVYWVYEEWWVVVFF